MANIEDCPGFESFGADIKEARKARHLSRRALAEMVNIDNRYLANIENEGTIPSLPVIIQLIKTCGLPVDRYFNPEIMRDESEQRQRVSHKLKLCPEQYLPIIEGAIDGAMQTEQLEKPEATEIVKDMNAGSGKLVASILQDLRKGKPCEVDAIVGVVVEAGKEVCVSTPYTEAVFQVIKKKETGEISVDTFPVEYYPGNQANDRK